MNRATTSHGDNYIMGIIEQVEQEARTPPEVWKGQPDKLEEWMGMVPAGTIPGEKDPSAIHIQIELAKDISEIIQPQHCSDQVEYGKVLARYKGQVPAGHKPGYITTVTVGKLIRKRCVFQPVRSKREVLQSPNFLAVIGKSISDILERTEPEGLEKT